MAKTGPYGIPQEDVKAYLKLQAERKAMEAAARGIKKREDALGAQLLELVRKRVSQEPGEFLARLGWVNDKPKWKEAFIERLGEAEAAKVEASVGRHQVLIVELSQKKEEGNVA